MIILWKACMLFSKGHPSDGLTLFNHFISKQPDLTDFGVYEQSCNLRT